MPDSDGDGIYDLYELTADGYTIDTDKDGIANHLDPDDDGDGILTINEGADPNNDGNPSDAQNSNPINSINTSNPYRITNALPDYLDDDDDGDTYATWETTEGGAGYKNAPANPATYAVFMSTDHDNNSIPNYLDYEDVKYPTADIVKTKEYSTLAGDKRYELSNHLGNVLAVISDRKLPSSSLTYFKPDVLSYSDYYPFGMLVPNRHGTSDSYRYGFQGQEKDDELKGEGNSLNYTFRMHDPRVGRFFAVDPLARDYPHYTPYSFSGNKVIAFVELEGMEERWVVKDNTVIYDPGPKVGGYDSEAAARAALTSSNKSHRYPKNTPVFSEDKMSHDERSENTRKNQMIAEKKKFDKLVYSTPTLMVSQGVLYAGAEMALEATGAKIIDATADAIKLYKFFKQSSVAFNTAKKVDALVVNKMYGKAPYDASHIVVEGVTKEAEIFVRVHGSSNQVRPWMMKAKDIEGLTAKEIKNKYALPELPEYISTVEVPKGTSMRTGKAAKVEGWGDGGGTQYEVIGERVQSSWFSGKTKIK